MRVLFVTNRYPTAETPGESPCIAQQRAALQQLGCDVRVLFIDSARSSLNYLKAVGQIAWQAHICRQFDLIHAHYGYLCGLVARMQLRCPVVVTFRGSDVLSGRERPLSRLLARRIDMAIVMTEEMKRQLGRADARVIPYGIDLELFKPYPYAEARRELGLPPKAPLVLFPYDPARALKRFDLLERALAILKSAFPDIQALTVCRQPHERIARYMSACDVMALTSDREGAPVAVREALACNLPIVSVDVGDVADIIRDVPGCHLARRDPDDIAQKLAAVLAAGQRTNGRVAAQRMGLAQSAAEVIAVYRGLL